jgi:hypothetical protein
LLIVGSVGLVEVVGDHVEVEPQPAFRSAEADAAELVGVGVDPIALDAEQLGELGGIDQALTWRRGRQPVGDEIGDALGDRLDLFGFEAHDAPWWPSQSHGRPGWSKRVKIGAEGPCSVS